MKSCRKAWDPTDEPMMASMVDESQKDEWKVPFQSYAKTMEEIGRLVDLTYEGVHRIIAVHQIYEITTGVSNDDTDEEKLREMAARAEMAQSEIRNEFPVLHSHAIIGAWSALEALVEDLAVAWVARDTEVFTRPEVAKIKISLAEYMTFSEADRIRHLVSELQRDLKVDLKSGATKFEVLLDAIGLGGQVDNRVRRSIYETQQMRNLFAHRAGIIDRRFIEACPWLELETGKRLRIKQEKFSESIEGMGVYVWTIMNRCFVKLNRKTVKREHSSKFEGALDFLDNPNGDEITTVSDLRNEI